ncbi:dipeptide ABC transporter ATP-binding protein [Pseudodesulfovibrio thermohalotolerans]|uniref:ABC transporter ATP-binding protein n=1 Tax=Pseudodesulfovibrio thermohalotolerans TaxID=2880651 RepID=UPI002442A6C9|nr:dipeptide ABC transporter ATP-binding protein [Pseudodesulfovibrio thermohalotolerans]WFS64147.1 dipeptide ABC transporter ATP-binding protein [Pseudodesulfovibrio thermohalotolerans]
MALLELINVTKHYKVSGGMLGLTTGTVRAVDGVNLSVDRGETLGLVGESGCGKSTLAKCIMGLEPITSGEVVFGNRSINAWDEKKLRSKMQMIFQDPYSSLNPRQKIGSIIREGLDIHDIGTRDERREKVAELLKLVGLRPEHGQRYPHEFSGGQRQRVAVARALALAPTLVVCDEPVSALDVSVQAQVLGLLKDLQKRLNLTYVFISHDLSVVSHICDRVAVMYLGRIMEIGPSEILFNAPRHPYTKALLSAVLRPDPSVRPERIALTGDLPSPMDPPKGCPFHPRCPEAFDKCRKERPELMDQPDGVRTACWLHDSL